MLGSPHPCGYLPGREARSAFLDPTQPLDPARYAALLGFGFRRSGPYVYRPTCATCSACRPVRIPVSEFRPDRGQRRCLRRNADLRLDRSRALGEEHFDLYRRYLSARHPAGGMDPGDREAFHSFLECPWGQTEVWGFRAGSQLLATAIVDLQPDSLSAVYTFFDPRQPVRSLGTLAVLKQIETARANSLPYLYLGYWVEASRKMAYKGRFRPLEVLDPQGWHRLEAA